MRITEKGEQVTISHVNQADLTHEAACAIRAHALGLYTRRGGEAAQRRLVPVHVTLTAEAPRRYDALAGLYGTRNIEFEAPHSSVTFLTRDLRTPAPHNQPGLSAVLRRHGEQTLAAAVPLRNWLDLFRRPKPYAAPASPGCSTTPTSASTP